ncbi:hypothetical protein NOM01_15425 [Sporolactobacillus sp. STSJ-5]|nr:hypothetical protein [Sporolactobacillus sp. STSJ-5]MCQ2011370.1 hypothetical protein [Sporolactobacillus sp. STSJ-5]
MGFDVPVGHPFGVHGQDFFFDILTDADLVPFQKLRFELLTAVPGYGYVHVAEADAQRPAAVPVLAVFRIFVPG